MKPYGRSPVRGASLVVVVLVVLLAAGLVAGCGGDADPFSGLYWEPSTGRRIEIRREGDAYRFYYGAGKRPYQAVRADDELRVVAPMGGEIVIRPAEEDGVLELVTGGTTSLLKPLPQHQ